MQKATEEVDRHTIRSLKEYKETQARKEIERAKRLAGIERTTAKHEKDARQINKRTLKRNQKLINRLELIDRITAERAAKNRVVSIRPAKIDMRREALRQRIVNELGGTNRQWPTAVNRRAA